MQYHLAIKKKSWQGNPCQLFIKIFKKINIQRFVLNTLAG
jgi:hypothetical protein